MKIKVFVGNDQKILFTSRGLESPTLIGYIYEYEVEEEDVEYWNLLNPDDRETMLGEAQKGKTDLRLLIKEKRRKMLSPNKK